MAVRRATRGRWAVARAPRALDVALALAAFAITLGILDANRGPRGGGLDPLGIALAGLATLPIAARRRAPLQTYAITILASSALYALRAPYGPPIGPAIALFEVAFRKPQLHRVRATEAVVIGLFAVHEGAAAVGFRGFPGPGLLIGIPLWAAIWIGGDRARLRRERVAELEERARRAERDAERERRLAAAEERTRIARDLHDSAGHAINVILVQAGAARLLQTQDPQATRVALETIEAVARETVGEIDQLVRVLREDEPSHSDVEAPPGLAALEGLAARQAAAGLETSVSVHGERRPLPAGLERTAYRILQEALTNAAKHGLGTAQVDLMFLSDGLELVVTNPAAPNGDDAHGHGLVGMRERAALVGGSLEAERREGRFRVRAWLPREGP